MDYPIKTLSQLRPILVGFRKEAGLTQEAIARRLGISQQSYAAFEANPETASVERLFRVLSQFDVAIRLGASERAGLPTVSATSPARMQARAGRKEADAAGKPAPAKVAKVVAKAAATSPPARKRRAPPTTGNGAPRAQRPGSKTREDW